MKTLLRSLKTNSRLAHLAPKLCIPLFALALLLTFTAAGVQASTQPPTTAQPTLLREPVNTFTVTSTADTGIGVTAAAGTLRWAMNQANASAGLDLIQFDLPGSGNQTITIKDWLPDLIDNSGVILDATRSDDRIILEAGNQNMYHYALAVYSNNNIIKGLTIKNATGNGIGLDKGASYNIISGNTVLNAWEGISVKPGSHDNLIGGTNGVTPGGACTGDCNLLSKNRAHGLVIDHADNNRVVGNYMGTDAGGNNPLPNVQDGLLLANSINNIIGGTTPEERNVISGNDLINVEIGQTDRNTVNNLFQGNFIGPNSAGTAAVGGPATGIVISAKGCSSIFDSNIISGNGSTGILILNGSNGNRFTNNRIGVDINGRGLRNNGIGVILQTNNNQFTGNIIANHPSDGIRVKKGTGNLLRMNSIYDNAKLGINLAVDGYTPNDPGDGDGGANLLQNFPVLTGANAADGSIAIQGSLNSKGKQTFTIDLYQNPVCNNTYNHQEAQGKNYLGSVQVTTNSAGNATFSTTLASALSSGIIAATATDAKGNTSEFSACRTITNTAPPPAVPEILTPGNGDAVDANPPQLDWAAANGAATYKILLRQDGKKGPVIAKVSGLTDHTFTPSALQTGHTYFWRVAACGTNNQCTNSVWYTFLLP